MARNHQKPISNVDIVDTNSLYRAQQALGGSRTSYEALRQVLSAWRHSESLEAAQLSLAFITRDPQNSKQGAFVDYVAKSGFSVDEVPFWTARVEPIGAAAESRDSATSLAPHVAYICGLIAGRAEASDNAATAVIVSGASELIRPCTDFVQRRQGRLAIAFYKSLLARTSWASEGLFDPDSSIRFIDLEPCMEKLIGVRAPTNSDHPQRLSGLSDL